MNGREDSHTYKHTQTEPSGIEIAKQSYYS